ncbi:ECF RNA polymerase sigma factor SigK [Kribbella solani]|uniref:ECF RNA polymerase sigma factor SigK n=1 Tax=Kribbella solani TaxID=236067 RepID=UPI0029BA8983|nr:ECF RNA polymerase sigma factor SigK [Kribbella solani]MDX2967894.1 ECF RNA polymerase sigma factor SigK [Kribbella solani]MDX3005128.1 ECF RNA polymerase sigma factor SigK [Kribbella solani]
MPDPIALPWPSRQGVVSVGDLLARTAAGDTAAFSALYDRVAPAVFGLVRRVLRNPAQSEEVTQEVMLDVWRTATRFNPERGSAHSWILTIAHRRAVDRVRSEQASADRTELAGARAVDVDFDQVADTVTTRLDVEQVRRCLGKLTELQRESVTLAYYNGYTYPEIAERLGAKLPTIKARMRDGLIRLRDCLDSAQGG